MIHPCIHQEQQIRTPRLAKPDSEATSGTTAQFPAPATTDATVMQRESDGEAAPYRWGALIDIRSREWPAHSLDSI